MLVQLCVMPVFFGEVGNLNEINFFVSFLLQIGGHLNDLPLFIFKICCLRPEFQDLVIERLHASLFDCWVQILSLTNSLPLAK